MKRALVTAFFALPVAVCLAIAAWPQGFGLEQAPIVAQVVAPRVGVIGIALALIVASTLFAAWKPTRQLALTVIALLTVFVLVSGGIHLSRGIGSTGLARTDGDLTVLTWNTLGDAVSARTLADVIRETDADVVALPETTEDLATEVSELLRDAGMAFSVHVTQFAPDYGALSTSLLISNDLGAYTTDPDVGQTRTLPTIVARPDDGDGPVIIATHPVAPIPGQMRNWRSDLSLVSELCSDNDSVIMAGDFNSTLDHWASLGTEGGDLGRCVDAAVAAGSGTSGTWPSGIPAWLGTQIDHVVATPDWQVVDAYVITDRDDSGSDHRPVVAVLRAH